MVSTRTLACFLLSLTVLASEHGVSCQRHQQLSASSTLPALRGQVRRMIEGGFFSRLLSSTTTASVPSAGGAPTTGGSSTSKTAAAADDDDDAGDDDSTSTATKSKSTTAAATTTASVPSGTAATAAADDDDGAGDDAAGDDAAGDESSSGADSSKSTAKASTSSKGGKASNATGNLNTDDDGYPTISGNITHNEDYAAADDDYFRTPADEVISDLTKKSEKMSMAKKEGIVAVIVVVVAIGAALAVKGRKYYKNGRADRAGYRRVGEVV